MRKEKWRDLRRNMPYQYEFEVYFMIQNQFITKIINIYQDTLQLWQVHLTLCRPCDSTHAESSNEAS
jgi:hypothetical protein